MFEDKYVCIKSGLIAALDSLGHAVVQSDMPPFCNPSHATSAWFLDYLITHQVLQFAALGNRWVHVGATYGLRVRARRLPFSFAFQKSF